MGRLRRAGPPLTEEQRGRAAEHHRIPELVARRMLRTAWLREEVAGAALDGFIYACRAFDPARSPQGEAGFGPYAAWVVRGAVCKELKRLAGRRPTVAMSQLSEEARKSIGLMLGREAAPPLDDAEEAALALASVTPRSRGVAWAVACGETQRDAGAAWDCKPKLAAWLYRTALRRMRKALTGRG